MGLVELFWTTVRARLGDTSFQARLVRGIGGTFTLRVTNVGLKFITSFILARLLGADGFGVYNFAISWLTLLIVPAMFGWQRLLVRDMAVYQMNQSWGLMRGLMRFSQRLTLWIAAMMVVVAAGAAWLTYEITGRPALLNADQSDLAAVAFYTLLVALAVLPMRALLLLQQSTMAGLRHIVTSQIPEQTIQPVLFVVAIGGLAVVARDSASAEVAMGLHLLSVAAALAVSMMFLRRIVPRPVTQATPVFQTHAWVASGIPLLLANIFAISNQQIDMLLLGALESAESVGLFAAAMRGTQLIAILLVAVNITLGPHTAQLYADNQHRELQRVLVRSARWVMLGALPITLGLIIFGRFFLGIYGAEFKGAYGALLITSIGQFVNAASGSVGMLLMMANRERDVTISAGISLALHVVLGMILIPRIGLNGAAWANTLTLATSNVIMVVFAWRTLGINTSIFGSSQS